MKNKFVILTITGLLLVSLAACGNEKTSNADQNTSNTTVDNQEEQDSQGTSETSQKDTEENRGNDSTEGSSDSTESGSNNQSGDLTFEDLSHYAFQFCSGAGGWSTDFEIEKDGSFKGNYHDSDMGDAGENYENGTIYVCVFSGDFTGLTKINDYTYEMKMENLTYEETPGKEEIADGVKYIYTDVYGLEGTDTFKVYLPGAPVSDLSEQEYFWVSSANENNVEGAQDTLTIPVIVNEKMEYGIYSYKRMTPYEEAKSTLTTYQASYDAAEEELQKATIQSRMDDYATQMYDISDSCLNEIWNLVKYNTSEEKFNEILNEQRKWIADKEATGNEIMENNDESTALMESSQKMAELTMERCKELTEYLK